MAESGERALAVMVLAAGKGTRMRSPNVPKVLHRILGRELVNWVLAAVEPLGASHTIAVVGHGSEQVHEVLPVGAVTAFQVEQRGSGDAVAAGMCSLEDFDGDVLVVNGDGALFTAETMRAVVEDHRRSGSVASALAISTDDPLPYGRIFQGVDGTIERIVEAGDATPDELAVRELNAGVYCFDAGTLRIALPQMRTDNSQGELYVTDLLGIVAQAGGRTRAVVAGLPDELLGVNTRADLGDAEAILRARINRRHMEAGVTIVHPGSVEISPESVIEPDAVIEAGSILRGRCHVAAGAVVGPYSTLEDTHVSTGATVLRSHCVSARVGVEAHVGPFAFLRPSAQLGARSKAGAFVELKNAQLGENAKVPHLSYIGDATVGAGTNIGAGTITANYRPELGRGKQRTVIGANVRTGSNNVFVAPVQIGDGAFTGAGSTIVEDVPSGALAIARAKQVILENYAERGATAANAQS